MYRRIIKTIVIFSLMFISSLCYAGDRELASCESVPGFSNTLSYVKIHMDTIKTLRNPQGDKCIRYFKEVHTLNTENQIKHIGTLLYVQVNFSTNMSRTLTVKTINYETGEILYPNTSFGWLELHPKNSELEYLAANYERYITQGTIGDNFRPFDENLTIESTVSEQYYEGPNGTFTEIPAQQVLSRYQGRWHSPDGRIDIEIYGDTVRTPDVNSFYSVKISGKGTISKGYGNLEYLTPPPGQGYSVSNLFWIYWDNGILEAEYFDGNGPHSRVKHQLIKVN